MISRSEAIIAHEFVLCKYWCGGIAPEYSHFHQGALRARILSISCLPFPTPLMPYCILQNINTRAITSLMCLENTANTITLQIFLKNRG